MFDRLGVVEATHAAVVDLETAAIECGAQNVEPLESEAVPAGGTGGRFFCEPSDLDAVSKALSGTGWSLSLSELSYIAKTPVELAAADQEDVTSFLTAIDDHDDVHRVYAALAAPQSAS
jgi:transcriptional/translational regulatory protein YebC/TACO1